jgi:hypothetical protein
MLVLGSEITTVALWFPPPHGLPRPPLCSLKFAAAFTRHRIVYMPRHTLEVLNASASEVVREQMPNYRHRDIIVRIRQAPQPLKTKP